MIITKTPYRISFFGGGSDYPIWYKKFGGSVLSTTIDKYIYISCRELIYVNCLSRENVDMKRLDSLMLKK